MPTGDMLRRSASRFPDKSALIFDDNMITYRELNERANRLANSLLKMGLKKGDRIGVLCHNGPEFIEVYFASAKVGGIFTSINNLLKPAELKKILDYLSPRFMFFDFDYAQLLGSMKQNLGYVEFFICLDGPTSLSSIQYCDLVDQGHPEEPEVSISDGDVMTIVLTSGTTGIPKGVMRTHRHNLIGVMASTIEFGIREDDRALFPLPFYHVTFEENMRHILMANSIVIRREGNFNAKEVLDLLSRQRITVCLLVPTMINTLLQGVSIERYDLSHFRLLLYGGSPMPIELLRKAMGTLKCQFLQLYGQTETGPLITVLKPEDHVPDGSEEEMRVMASAGRPAHHCEVRIVDDSGNDVPVGEVGEIVIRSDAMSIGYWELPEETAKLIKDGWLYTGDFGRFDERKYVYIVDRKTDMIISGGKNIYPREIEEVLYSHEAVLEASVIGIPDEHWGESVKAIVVLKDNREASEEEIISFCKDKLASYKKPKSVEFRQELPKNPSGKILKRMIREQYWKARDRKV